MAKNRRMKDGFRTSWSARSGAIALAMAVMMGMLVSPAQAAQGDQSAEPTGWEALPTKEDISEMVGLSCSQLLLWEKDSQGDEAALKWKADYGKCAISAIDHARVYERIGEYCQSEVGSDGSTCFSDVFEQNNLGPQTAAYVEACLVVDHVYQGACAVDHILDALGLQSTQSGGTEDPCGHPITIDGCIEYVEKTLCDNGICIRQGISVAHGYTDFIADDACAGARVELSGSAAARGWVFTLGIFTYWSVKAEASVAASVEWELQCATPAEITGSAEGGFMRQLRIERGHEQRVICQYDGFDRTMCGNLPGESWLENTLATGEGAFDGESETGVKPPSVMDVATKSGGQWVNEFQGSLRIITYFDVDTPVLHGNRLYPVNYGSASDFGLLGDVEGLCGSEGCIEDLPEPPEDLPEPPCTPSISAPCVGPPPSPKVPNPCDLPGPIGDPCSGDLLPDRGDLPTDPCNDVDWSIETEGNWCDEIRRNPFGQFEVNDAIIAGLISLIGLSDDDEEEQVRELIDDLRKSPLL